MEKPQKPQKRSTPAKPKDSPAFWSSSGAGMLALGMSLACAIGYGATQLPSKAGFMGEVERQWRDGKLYPVAGGPLKYVSGDLVGHSVSDPQFGLTVNAAMIERRVSAYQWVEDCKAGACSVSAQWRDAYVDAKKFKTPGYSNPQTPASLEMASRVTIGSDGVSAGTMRKLLPLAKPYAIGENDVDVPGLYKVNGEYWNFKGAPQIGSYKVSYRQLPLGVGVTMVGERGLDGDLTVGADGRFAAKVGVMGPEDFIGLQVWERPRFGHVLLAMCAALFASGMFGLWSANKIERQMAEERRLRERRTSQHSDRRVADRRKSPRRDDDGPPSTPAPPRQPSNLSAPRGSNARS